MKNQKRIRTIEDKLTARHKEAIAQARIGNYAPIRQVIHECCKAMIKARQASKLVGKTWSKPVWTYYNDLRAYLLTHVEDGNIADQILEDSSEACTDGY